jgi:Flp pilus assembly protein TadD
MRRSGIEPVRAVAFRRTAKRRTVIAAALVVVAAGLGYGAYRSSAVSLEERAPMRPLAPRELSAYLRRDQVSAGAYEAMLAPPDVVEGWPVDPARLAERLGEQSSRWSLEQPLRREVLTAERALALMDEQQERVALYPLETAAAMTALLRAQGSRAMVAEAWELEGAQAPADPSGALGYFVTAVYEEGDETPSAFFDPWGGRGEITPVGARVLRDTEVLGAALGTEAIATFERSGDGSKALSMVESALLLDPVSPTLRVVHATVLAESGGFADAVQELRAAKELRPDAPRQVSLAQLLLAQAGMLEMGGQEDAAEAQLSEANRLVTQALEQWPRYGRAHVALATLYLASEDLARARAELEAAQVLAPDAPMLWAGWAQYHLAEDDAGSASASIRRAVELDPDNWQLRLQAAGVFDRAGEADAARASVAAALDLVAPDKRSKVREYATRMIGPQVLEDGLEEGEAPARAQDDLAGLDLPDPTVPALPAAGERSADPALQLGDPSSLRLRDPDQRLELDLDE